MRLRHGIVRTMRRLLLIGLLLACGKKSDGTAKKEDGGLPTTNVANIPTPVIGVDQIKRFGFVYGDGMREYDKAVTLYRAKARDWAAIRAACEVTLAKDPSHLDAHRLLASALVSVGEPAAAVDHLVTALAADYYKYNPSIASDTDLKDFLATPHGQAVTGVAAKIGAAYAKEIAASLWIVGRRSSFKWPRESGVAWNTSRGEVYAYDRETRRFLRLTHTEHQVAGFVKSSGNEIAVLGFDKTDHPRDDSAPLLARPWLEIVDTAEWKLVGKRIVLGAARGAWVGYGPGDQLLVATAASTGRWTVGDWGVSAVDRSTGKLTKTSDAPPVPRVELTIEEGRLIHATDGVKATWAGEPPQTASIETTVKLEIPESGAATQASLAVSPDGALIAFATAVDPCAKDAASSLYVDNAKTGRVVKHLLTAKSRFATRWLDATTLAYEDGDGAIRIWDAKTLRETGKLDNKVGVALDALSLEDAPLCKQAPPSAANAGSGSDEPTPEESPGPTTTP